MDVIHNFLVNNYSIKAKAIKIQKYLTLKENDFVFSINHFDNSLFFSKLENKFGIFNIFDFISFQRNSLDEFESLSKTSINAILSILKDKKIILSFDLTHIKEGIFILSFPNSITFENKKQFQEDFILKMNLLFAAHNIKKSFKEVSNVNNDERHNQKNAQAMNWIDCRDDLVNFIVNSIKSSKK